jgi:hypothetical protein
MVYAGALAAELCRPARRALDHASPHTPGPRPCARRHSGLPVGAMSAGRSGGMVGGLLERAAWLHLSAQLERAGALVRLLGRPQYPDRPTHPVVRSFISIPADLPDVLRYTCRPLIGSAISSGRSRLWVGIRALSAISARDHAVEQQSSRWAYLIAPRRSLDFPAVRPIPLVDVKAQYELFPCIREAIDGVLAGKRSSWGRTGRFRARGGGLLVKESVAPNGTDRARHGRARS